MLPEAKQQGFTPACGIVDVIVVQLLHAFRLHFHHRCLGELVTLFFREINHVLGSGGLTHLVADLGIGLHEGSKGGES